MEIEYRVIKDHPNYEVSNLGEIRRIETKEEVYQSISGGYLRVSLDGEKLYVHRLVAEAFVPNPNHKPFATHKDGDPMYNSSRNLVWTTARESQKIAAFRKKLSIVYKNYRA